MNNFKTGICAAYVNFLTEKLESIAYFATISVYYNLSLLLPILTFFLFDVPHDCFSCLAKDPNHTYSIH